MRGLAHFIQDIRKATGNQKEEETRVEEELAKIRAKFIDPHPMSLYDRKKYVCKLMFIQMLGYPITFGHMEGIKLMAEDTPSEKLIGYLSSTVLLNENSELLMLTTHTVYRDLMSGIGLNCGLALTAVANTGGRDFAEVMHEGVQKIVMDDRTDVHIRKKALLTLLHIFHKYPEMVDLALVVPKAAELLLCGQDGVSMCATTFLNGCFSKRSETLFRGIPAKLIEILGRVILDKRTEPGYVYYGVPAPWLQSKVLRFLQFFPEPRDPQLRDRVLLVLRKIIKATGKVLKDAQTQQKQRGTQNRVNAMNAVLFEVVSLAIQWDVGSKIIMECADVISSFIADKREANLRYIGLTLLSRLSFVRTTDFDFQAHCRQYQQQIIVGLHDPDVSIRKKALEVLVTMCTPSNATDIIKELLTYLPISTEPTFRTSLVLSITLLAEKFCDDNMAYVDIMLTVVAQSGDTCPPEIACRVVQAIVNDPAVQKRATFTVFNTLRSKKYTHQTMVQVAAFVLGEFGYQIALNAESMPGAQFALLHSQLSFASPPTQGMILTAFFKFYSLYDSAAVRENVLKTLRAFKSSAHPELQQRATEYMGLIENGNVELLEKVLEPIPAFKETVNVAMEKVKALRSAQDIWAEKILARDQTDAEAKKKEKRNDSDVKKAIKLSDLSSADVQLQVQPVSPSVRDSEVEALFYVSLPSKVEVLQRTYNEFQALFTSLLKKNEGVLYSDATVELRCTQTYRLADGRITVTVHNKGGQGLSGVSLKILTTEAGLLLQSRCTDGDEVAPHGQVGVEFAARSLSVFHDPPSIRLAYTVAGESMPHVETLSLPVTAGRFLSPYDVDTQEDYMQLFDSVKRTSTPAIRSVSCSPAVTKDDVLKGLPSLGFHPCATVAGDVVGLAAYATQPREKVDFSPVACEVSRNGGGATLTVYASSTIMQSVLLDTLQLVV